MPTKESAELQTRAEWDQTYINDLPDSAFAVILAGGEKDEDGRTTPRSLRKLPHHDADGKLDFPHLLNALSREPQTDIPAAMHERAQAHLQGHREADRSEAGAPLVFEFETDVEVRDAAKREIDMRLLPWDFPIDTLQGREQFVRGAFDGTDPSKVLLMGLEHEAHMGVHNGQPVLVRRPVGKGMSLRNDATGPVLTVRVAKTAAGDELLALADERIVSGVSAEFFEVPGGTTTTKVDGRQMRTHNRVNLKGVSLTYRPAYGEQATVLAVRSQPQKEITVPEAQPVPESTPIQIDVTPLTAAIAQLGEMLQTRSQTDAAELKTEIDGLKEQMRTQITIPTPEPVAMPAPHLWFQRAVFERTGERVPDELRLQTRALDDTTVAQNEGLFANFVGDEVITNISKLRPFLSSTREVDAPPPNTMTIQLPKVTQHTEFGVQATEKTAIASRDLRTTPVTYDMVSIFGGTDVSIQFIKRGTPTAMRVLLDDMEAGYAQQAETEALDALLDEADVVEGGTLDPQNTALGAGFTNAYAALGQGPDTLWLSTVALSSFINAKASTTNQPLYGSIVADINAAGGISGSVSGLRVVHVPALTAVGALIGPSRAFSWAEQYPIRLEVDNPELAGRDIALGGFMWFMPRYPAAFTSYNVIGS